MSPPIGAALPAQPANPAATPPPKDGKDLAQVFTQLVGGAEAINGLAAAAIDAPPPARPEMPADQSLEALLSALKLTLAPGAGLLKPAGKKAGEGDKAPAGKDKPAKDNAQRDDPSAALLAAFDVMPLPGRVAAKDGNGQSKQTVDGILGKPTLSPVKLTDLPPNPLPPVPNFDLSALADAGTVRAPQAAPPANGQLERLLDTARDTAWLDRLSQDIAASAGSGDKLRFRMMPPNLGKLDVSVERQATGMSVSMTTHTVDARNLIADSRQQMVDILKAQGVPLVQLSLSTAGDDLERHRPPTFFNHIIEAAPASGTDLAAQPVESTTAERIGRFA